MLEVFLIIQLCMINSRNAKARGRRPGGFIALTIILWAVFELVGIVLGVFISDGSELTMLLIAFPVAALGGLISYLIAKNCHQGDYVDPNAVPVPTVTVGPNGAPIYSDTSIPAYMINQGPVLYTAQPVQPMQPMQPMQAQPVQQMQPVQQVQAQPAGVSSGLRYCRYCGAPNNRTNRFCESCGHIFE